MIRTTSVKIPIDHFSPVGVGISGEDRLCLSVSLVSLQASQNYAHVEFWGMVQTCDCSKDYYVAIAWKEKPSNDFMTSTVFACQDALNWVQLPPVSEEEMLGVCRLGTLLSGDPNFEHALRALPFESTYLPLSPCRLFCKYKFFYWFYLAPPHKSNTIISITELKRLSAIVRLVQQEATIAPRNAYMCGSEPKKMVHNNPYYRGLAVHELNQLSTFGHLRPPVNENDRLDSIESDIPGSWTFHTRPMYVVVSNMIWPGYFHYANDSGEFASIYMGHGRKNVDLGFML